MTMGPNYATQSTMSDPGRHRAAVAALPETVDGVARAIQGLCIHDFVAAPFYGVAVPASRSGEIHIRGVEALLDQARELDGRPLGMTRPPEQRLAIRCRHYALLHVSALRERGVRARMRAGFAAYFNPPYFEDHWITEYWHEPDGRWTLVDPQLDDVWMEKLGGRDDPFDLARDRFIVAGDAWKMCRSGKADPQKFGIGIGNLRGLWFVASSLVRDLAALNKVEMLPWDVWGAQPSPEAAIAEDDLALFDDIAQLTADANRSPASFAALYEGNMRLKVGPRVFNAITMRMEPAGIPAAA